MGFRPEYAKLRPQVPAPDLSAFINASMDVLKDEREPLRLHFERARDASGLAGLSTTCQLVPPAQNKFAKAELLQKFRNYKAHTTKIADLDVTVL